MSAFELSWYLKIDEHRTCGVKPQATLEDLLPQIKIALDNSGVVSISLVNCPTLGPQRLQLLTENGQSTITLGEPAHKDIHVRGYSWQPRSSKAANDDAHNREPRNKQLVCAKAETVYQIFEEFFETGNVSEARLN